MHSREKGYVYFQEFIHDNEFDTRIVVIGDKAIAERRFVRKGDFRASGSGEFSYDNIVKQALRIVFDIANKLKLQSVAFDFVIDQNINPLIVEMSYEFSIDGISKASGYWDRDLNWHESRVLGFSGWIVEELITEI